MEITANKKIYGIEIKIVSENTTIVEDVSIHAGIGKRVVEEETIDQFINAAIELNEYNGAPNVVLIERLCQLHLSKHDKEELIEKLNEHTYK